MNSMNLLKLSGLMFVFLGMVSCSSSEKMALSCPEPANQNKNRATPNYTRHIRQYNRPIKRNREWNYAYTRNRVKPGDQKNGPAMKAGHDPVSVAVTPKAKQDNHGKSEYVTCFYASTEGTDALYSEPYASRVIQGDAYYADSGSDELIQGRADIKPAEFMNPNANHLNYNAAYVLPEASLTDSLPRDSTEKARKKEGLGIAGMSVGILGLITPIGLAISEGILFAGIPLGIIAIVSSISGLVKISRNKEKLSGKGYAIAGMILGILDILLVLAIFGLMTII